MKIKYIWVTIALSLVATIATVESNAQYRRYPDYPGVYHGGGARVSIGIGGIFGFGRWGGYYGGPSVGVSVMLPPIVLGSRVRSLPPGSRRVYYGGVPYYYRGNTYYRNIERGDGYEVVEPPLGATVGRLPAGARKRTINGQIYYEYNGNYYMSDSDNMGEGRYIVVGKEGKLDTEEALHRRTESLNRNSDEEYNDDDRYNNNNDDSYNRRSPRNSNDEVIVRNANEDGDYSRENNNNHSNDVSPNKDEVYSSAPQVGDRFENLPRNTKTITVGGQTQHESPSGTRYKEVSENGKPVYEVVKTK